VTAAKGEAGETVVLTGHVQAENEPAFAFRIAGRMIERPINVGDRVEAGQVLAKLDPENELNALRSAESALAAARGQLTYARGDFDRQRQLLANGHTPRARFDQSQNALQSAQSQVDNTEAQLRIARDHVGWTTLEADAPGTVTARGAEPGEVVQAGQMIVRLARQGGRDAARRDRYRQCQIGIRTNHLDSRLRLDRAQSPTRCLDRRPEKSHGVDAECGIAASRPGDSCYCPRS